MNCVDKFNAFFKRRDNPELLRTLETLEYLESSPLTSVISLHLSLGYFKTFLLITEDEFVSFLEQRIERMRRDG